MYTAKRPYQHLHESECGSGWGAGQGCWGVHAGLLGWEAGQGCWGVHAGLLGWEAGQGCWGVHAGLLGLGGGAGLLECACVFVVVLNNHDT